MRFLRPLMVLFCTFLIAACSAPQKSSSPSARHVVHQRGETQSALRAHKVALSVIKPKARVALAYGKAVAPKPERTDELNVRDFKSPATGLKGRTIYANSLKDLQLRPKEVVLTFDDGPRAIQTPKILNALEQYGVKATFFMVGRVARANSSMVKTVAARGHSVASHTENHPNLAKMSLGEASAEIDKGYRSVAHALGQAPTRFFRFPYLADSASLRKRVVDLGMIDVAPDIDSKDYFKSTPIDVLNRTMARIRKRGRGIVLFHDIHARTALMMPRFLKMLKAEGYQVVHIKAGPRRPTQIPAS